MFPRICTLTTALALISTALMLTALPASAQFWEGTDGLSGDCHQRYDIRMDGVTTGHMVAVSSTCTSQPAGFGAGQEHWSWLDTEWPRAFNLVPVNSGPEVDAVSWEVFPLDSFDLDSSAPIPPVSTNVDDGFYAVFESDDSSSTGLTLVAYMHLHNTPQRMQSWYGIEGVLTEPYVGVGATIIRLEAASPPPANSVDVHIIDGIIDHGDDAEE